MCICVCVTVCVCVCDREREKERRRARAPLVRVRESEGECVIPSGIVRVAIAARANEFFPHSSLEKQQNGLLLAFQLHRNAPTICPSSHCREETQGHGDGGKSARAR